MAPSLSKFVKPIYAPCSEIWHPHTQSCSSAALELTYPAIRKCLKLYSVLYFITFLIKRRRLTQHDLYKYLRDVLQSSVYIAVHPLIMFYLICIFRNALGRAYIPTITLVPTFCSSLVALPMERQSRQKTINIYVANLATESVFLMLESRGYAKRIKNGQVLILSVSLAVYSFLMKSGQLQKDLVQSILKFILGNDETAHKEANTEYKERKSGSKYLKTARLLMDHIADLVKSKTVEILRSPKHRTCRHEEGCLFYVAHGFARSFVIGYLLKALAGLQRGFERVKRQPSRLITEILFSRNNVAFGTTLGLFGGLFKLVSCLLRWTRNKDCSQNALVAGFLSSLVFVRSPNTTVSLYVMWKLIDVYLGKGIEAGFLPYHWSLFYVCYAVSMSILAHCIIVEPENLRRSYFQYLDSFIGYRTSKYVNPKLLELLQN